MSYLISRELIRLSACVLSACILSLCVILSCGCDSNAISTDATSDSESPVAEPQAIETQSVETQETDASESANESVANSASPTNASEADPASERPNDSRPESASAASADRRTDDASNQPVVIRRELNGVDWDSLVGTEVQIEGDLVVVDTYDLIRRGQVVVARSPASVPTAFIDPNDASPEGTNYQGGSNTAQVAEAQKRNDTATITLDDGSAEQNIFPPTLFPELGAKDPTVRLGSTVTGVSGKIVKAGRKLLLVVDEPLDWTPSPRPARPDVGDADITVASFNVLNYFTTIDDRTNNARGADSKSELERQEAKLVAAIQGLQADIVGVMEIENNLEAESKLVELLNKSLGQDLYQGCGLPTSFRSTPGGSDAIRVGIIYRKDRVTPVGAVQTIDNEAFAIARAPVVQTFRANEGGRPFTVIVNHFKSKGGAGDADPGNKNKGDGQGAFNAARRAQALSITEYVKSRSSSEPDTRVLVIGDLNAYQQEDPIDAFRANGFIDLHEKFSATSNATDPDPLNSYSYVYYGQRGNLDHALATTSLAGDVTGVAVWHINADEPRSLDYNEEYNPDALYKPDPFRSSDHDPVLIGLRK